ncbi:MAG: hypothetical protein HYT87_15620 [Nitrospirae bacterium]|nr:hypothetical protein [Nitrospirota bacterium]
MKYLLMLSLILLPAPWVHAREPKGIYPEIRGTFDPVALAPVLEKGTIVIIHEEPGKPTFLTGILLIHASFEKVWSVVTDYEKYHEFVPNVIRNTVLQRHPETHTQDTEYKTGFKAGPIELGIVWTLEQHLEKDEHTIWAGPSKIGEQAFSAVNYREIYFPVDEHRTIMTYTNYADLASFGALAKLVFKTFPELETPTLVSVGTLFPESIKERVEGTRVIVEPKEFDRDRVKIPPPIENSGVLDGLIRRFRKIVLSWYPDSNGIRFFSALALVDAPSEQCKAVVSDFASYPRIFKTVESTRKVKGTPDRFTMEYRMKYKVALPLTFEYSLDYTWDPEGRRLSFALNRIRDHTIEGEWGAWDFYPSDEKTLVGYTSFTDLRSGGLFLRLLMDNIAGFGTGFRVGLNSMVMQALSSAMAKPTPRTGEVPREDRSLERPHVSNGSEVGF